MSPCTGSRAIDRTLLWAVSSEALPFDVVGGAKGGVRGGKGCCHWAIALCAGRRVEVALRVVELCRRR